ncbi:MAG: lipid-binding SYLF domain-containing protein [Acidobacteriota bacterium]|nr:lipid-binding SYLF domain-containing protein [Acidobacteriota bacterium]
MNRSIALAVVVFTAASLSLAERAAAKVPPDEKVRIAAEVYEELLNVPEREVPRELVQEAKCVAIIPGVIKGAFGWGGRHGRGVLTCRTSAGSWSPPIFVTLSGASFGLQIGAQSTDIVLFFMSERSVRSLLKSKFTLGGDVSVAAGPLGRSAELGTDIRLRAEIYSYAKSRGLFAGMSVEGARLAPKQELIDKYYGERIWPDEVLFGRGVSNVPVESRRLIEALK